MKALRQLSVNDRAVALAIAADIIDTADQNASTRLKEALHEIFPELALEGSRPEISIVLPIFNEEANITELYQRLSAVIRELGTSEIIFVDDGSSDRSVEMILELRNADSQIKLLRFSRNFGHQAAISAGIDFSRGNAVVLMDSDLQDPPEILPEIFKLWEEGADVVYAVRTKRKENIIKRSAYFFFYRLLQLIANVDIPLDSGDFCLLDRRVVDHLKSMPERNRFLRGLRSWIGFKQVPYHYERSARYAGDAKYTFRKLLGLALNGIISFSSFPLRLATYVGFVTCFAGVIYVIYAVSAYLVYHMSPQGWTSLTVLFLIVGGVQLIILGTIGEYISRMYDEVKQRPNYIVNEFFD